MAAFARRERTLGDLLGKGAGGYSRLAITDLTLDSRAVRPGAAFVALRGGREHGAKYARAALDAGAAIVLFEPGEGVGMAIDRREAVLAGLGAWAGAAMSARASADPLSGAALYADVKAYSTLGEHRTGTAGDAATTAWLEKALKAAGYSVERQGFDYPVFELAHAASQSGQLFAFDAVQHVLAAYACQRRRQPAPPTQSRSAR